MTLYRIKNWNDVFENNRTRELKKLDWFPVPNKHDGDGYTELIEHPNGMAHYGAWLLIVAVASKCDERGTLLRDGAVPHDARSLARKTRGSAKVFEEVLPRLVAIGWLEVIPCNAVVSDEVASSCGKTAPSCEQVPIEGKGREGNGRVKKVFDGDFSELKIPPHLQSLAFSEKWKAWIALRMTMKKSKDWFQLFQRQLETLGDFSEANAIAIVNKSLVNEYQGLITDGPGHQNGKQRERHIPNI